LQQVAIVAGDLDHPALRSEVQPTAHLLDIPLAMGEPGVGEGGEVGVLSAEDVLAGDVLVKLHEEAVLADERVERVEWLHLVELLAGQEALAERRLAEVNEGMRE